MRTLRHRIEQAGGISALTCVREGSPENNLNVIMDLKSTIYALTLELYDLVEAFRDDEPVSSDKLAELAELASAYEFRAGLKRRVVAAEEAASNG